MRPTARKRLATRMGAGCRHFGLVWVYASACAATLHSPQRRHSRAGGNPQRQANQAKPPQPLQPAFMRPTARKRLATRMGAGCRHFGLVWVYASACAATLHSPQRRHSRAGGNPQRQANQAKPAQPAQPAQPAFMRPTARKRLATRMEAGCRRFGLFGFGMRLGLRR